MSITALYRRWAPPRASLQTRPNISAGGKSLKAIVNYVPMDRRVALAGGQARPERVSGAALFADLAGFTPITEAIAQALGPYRGAEKLFAILNRTYNVLMAECDRYGGSVVGYSGDAITVWFDGEQAATPVQAGRRAVACAQAMLTGMEGLRTVLIPDRQPLTLDLKTTVSIGPVRRFLVGDPDKYLLEVLAGATMARLARAAHWTRPGRLVLDADTCTLLSAHLDRVDYERAEGENFAIVRALAAPVEPQPWPPLPAGALSANQVRAWLLPPVYARLQSGQGEFLAELRHTVSLFLRFTDLDYDNDDEAGLKLDAFVRWVQQVLTRYEGWLLHVTIGDKGSYFYATFGAPVAHGDDAARAVAAALELAAPPAELAFIENVHIGINGGQTRTGAVGESTRFYSADGDPVNLAARLMQEATAGQILLHAKLAPAVSRHFVLEPLPPRQVKGKANPVPIVAVTGRQPTGSIRLQEPQSALPLVGRTAEVALIADKLALAQHGQGQLIGITGEAGIGKSRLVAEAIRRASAAGFVGLGGAAQSTGTQTAYLAWQPIWRAFFDLDAHASFEEQTAALERNLTELAPNLQPRLPLLGLALGLPLPDNDLTRSLDAKQRKEMLEQLLVDCLKARLKPVTANGETRHSTPLLLVLEDVHWLDALSLDLLTAIGRAIANLPALLAVAYRPPETEQAPRFPFLGMPHSTEIHLLELTHTEAAQLIEHQVAVSSGVPRTLPPPFIEAITTRAEGNPFYIEELLSYLQDRGVAPGDMAAFARLELPASLSSLILSRIDQLTITQQTTLKVASVIGRDFRFAWLWGVYPGLGEPERVRQDLDWLAWLNITPLDTPYPDLRYLFNHATTQQVIYESLSFTVREQLHEQLAAWLEARMNGAGSLDLVAYHYGRSANTDKQREYFRKAGDAAAARYANAAAIQYYERLLGLLPPAEQAPVLIALARILANTSAWDAAEARYREVLALTEGTVGARWHAQALLGLGFTIRSRMRYEEAMVWLERARSEFAGLGDREGLSETVLEIGRTYWYQGKGDQAQRMAEQTLALEGENGDKPRIALALHVLGMVALSKLDFATAREWWFKSLDVKREIGDKPGVASTTTSLAVVAFLTGRLDEARTLATESVTIHQELQARWEYALSRTILGFVLATQGEAARARTIQYENLSLFAELGALPMVDTGLLGLAHATQLAEPGPEASRYAVTLVAAGNRINATPKYKRMPYLQIVADRIMAEARKQLDQADVEATEAEGSKMDWSQAVAYALSRGHGPG